MKKNAEVKLRIPYSSNRDTTDDNLQKIALYVQKKKKLRSLTLQFFCITCACSWSLMINIIVIIEIITNYNKNIIFYRI